MRGDPQTGESTRVWTDAVACVHRAARPIYPLHARMLEVTSDAYERPEIAPYETRHISNQADANRAAPTLSAGCCNSAGCLYFSPPRKMAASTKLVIATLEMRRSTWTRRRRRGFCRRMQTRGSSRRRTSVECSFSYAEMSIARVRSDSRASHVLGFPATSSAPASAIPRACPAQQILPRPDVNFTKQPPGPSSSVHPVI